MIKLVDFQLLKPLRILRNVPGAQLSNLVKPQIVRDKITIGNNSFTRDGYTNVTERILSLVGKNLHTLPYHPLSLVREKIVNYFYKTFDSGRGSPLFSVFDNLFPVVTVEQNFDSLLIPLDHPSRLKSDCYYINYHNLLRAHTTAHQAELIRSGLNNFLIAGDVYRRDEIDRTHYPVFHQLDAVRLKTRNDLFFQNQDDTLSLFEEPQNNSTLPDEQSKQACHSFEAYKLMEYELKSVLAGLAKELFGHNIKYRWVDTTFPFTQPSWELEIYHNNDWLEVLGCGIMVQSILANAGVNDRIGWAFGIGLERIAMCLYEIPDIRLFWSQDSGFLNQFKVDSEKTVVYKQISQYPQCVKDISFWLPQNVDETNFSSNDFYDLVRNVGGDIVEQVLIVDQFTHPKTHKHSHCYRIIYRHMERTLTNEEVNLIHHNIAETAKQKLGVTIR